ncbi:Hypothetical protein CINCED_3A003849 [Cinara cedri]|uniref:Uncharacterized protein n=1 Tax=Cinara cedri TaxID=506608 RepID=A0A5E4MZI9_9HEMI|nr:Hypothetical protein CINCED_3A003849 [Cinara cedri]
MSSLIPVHLKNPATKNAGFRAKMYACEKTDYAKFNDNCLSVSTCYPVIKSIALNVIISHGPIISMFIRFSNEHQTSHKLIYTVPVTDILAGKLTGRPLVCDNWNADLPALIVYTAPANGT